MDNVIETLQRALGEANKESSPVACGTVLWNGVIDALAALRNPWRPIEEAEGTEDDVLVGDGKFVAVACWGFGDWLPADGIEDMNGEAFTRLEFTPTHYMPLPPAPEQT